MCRGFKAACWLPVRDGMRQRARKPPGARRAWPRARTPPGHFSLYPIAQVLEKIAIAGQHLGLSVRRAGAPLDVHTRCSPK